MERVVATKVQAKPAELYEADFYVWALAQADLLRARRFDALDLENLIEEVEGLADTKLAAVLSNAAVVIEHLLELQHSAATDPRNSWRAGVREHRRRLWIESTRGSPRSSRSGFQSYTRGRATMPPPACATMGSTPPPTRCRPPAPTLSTRSPATGGLER